MSVAIETQPRLATEPRGQVAVVVADGLRILVSPDDFATLCRYNGDLRLERSAEGVLIAMSPAGSKSGRLEMWIAAPLFVWANLDHTGLAFGPTAGFTLPNGAVRAPDASWIKLERWNALTKEQQESFAPIVPDFVVELSSPSDRRQKTHEKLVEYLEQGARLGWLIDPKTREVEIHRPGRKAETLLNRLTLSDEDILPGFFLDLIPIFQEKTAAQAGGTDG